MTHLFDLSKRLAEEVVALHDKSADESVVVSGYTLGGMYDTATELLPLLGKADELLASHLHAAWAKGVKDAEEAREFSDALISDLREAEARL